MRFFIFGVVGFVGVAVALDTRYQHAVSHIRHLKSAQAVTRDEAVVAAPEATGNSTCAPYWMENIKHQGVAAFNKNATTMQFNQNGTYGLAGYQVFRNVKDYGAVGDGVTDDTAAIQKAITDGGRCAPAVCMSNTNTPAVVYFPEGVYAISASIIDYYYTQVSWVTL
jgi:glucan 1,3-beta-glucosidase